MFGEQWEIGQKSKDNGVVFLIATQDRTMSIQQGRNTEQYLTASVAGQILDYIVTPNFKKGKWYEGIDRGSSAIMEALQGKFKADPKQEKGNINVFEVMLITFIILIILGSISKGRGGNNDDDDDVILTRGGRRSYPGGFFPFPGSFGGGRSSGGGGFGGFGGGGSFGGGGASGGW